MARTGIDVEENQLEQLEPLIERLHGKQGRFERMSRSTRWLVLEPADGTPGISIEIQSTERLYNLVVHNRAIEPGTEARGTLGQHGVTTPVGWQLAADVGWVLGWRVPPDTEVRKIVEFGFKVVHVVSPVQGGWRAKVEPRPPRPGFTEVKE
ncbi:hypothetical protein BH10ACT11_BH10ACT11_22040 [soil metagenome]